MRSKVKGIDEMEGGFIIDRKTKWQWASLIFFAAVLLYTSGFLAQWLGNYAQWLRSGSELPASLPSLSPAACLAGLLWFPYGLYGLGICLLVLAGLMLYRRAAAAVTAPWKELSCDASIPNHIHHTTTLFPLHGHRSPRQHKYRPYPQSRHETDLAIRQTESRGPPGPLLIDFIVLLRDFAGGAVLEFRRTFFFTILYALCNVIRQVAVPVLSIAAAAAARSCGAGCPGCGKRRFSPYSDSKDPQA